MLIACKLTAVQINQNYLNDIERIKFLDWFTFCRECMYGSSSFDEDWSIEVELFENLYPKLVNNFSASTDTEVGLIWSKLAIETSTCPLVKSSFTKYSCLVCIA